MYSEISEIYHKLFPLNPAKVKFIEYFAKYKGSIIDAGCASGELSVKLAKKGYNVIGVDLDSEMIDIAKSNSENLKNLSFRSGSISNLSEIVPENNFDMILCWGNTIPHLKNDEEIKKFIHASYDKLIQNGVISIQLLNHGKILKEGIMNLPVKETAEYIFKREFEFPGPDVIKFNAKIILKDTGRVINDFSVHKVIKHNDLHKHLSDAGFKNIISYSDFDFKEFTANEISFIINASK